MAKKKEYRRVHKIISRVTEDDYTKLEHLSKLYGLKSVYSLLSYITYIFLRSADQRNGVLDSELPENVIRLFDVGKEASEIYMTLKRKRKKRRKNIPAKQLDLFASEDIQDEIEGMFRDAQDEGRDREFNDNYRKRTER